MQPVAKRGDHVVGVDTHVIIIDGAPTPTPLPFDGTLDDALSPNVLAEHQPVAVVSSQATNQSAHVATGGSFQKPPSNEGRVIMGSATVLVNNQPIARNGDVAETCNDPTSLPVAAVVAAGTVISG